MIPDTVLRLLYAAFPGESIGELAPTFGGFSNLTVAATIGGARCVVKAASLAPKRSDVRREAQVLTLLRGSGLPAPELLALADDDGWTVAVTRAVAGEPGLRLYARPPDELAPIFVALGATLARVHAWDGVRAASVEHGTTASTASRGGAPSSVGLGPSSGAERAADAPGVQWPVAGSPSSATDLNLAARAVQTRASLEGLALEPELHDALATSLEHAVWRPEVERLVHGDAGLHNMIWDGGLAALLDWEWSGWGTPLLDLAWVAWTMRFRAVAPASWDAFVAGYGREQAQQLGLESGALRALALGQIAGLLVRSHGRADAWEEWVRRLRWTVDWVP